MTRLRLPLVIVVAVTLLTGFDFSRQPTADDLVGFFDSIALQDDTSLYGGSGTVAVGVTRWEQPLNVWMTGVSADIRRRLWWHLDRTAGITGLSIAEAGAESRANLIISLVSSAEIVQRTGSADTLCLAQPQEEDGRILYVALFIPIELPVWLDGCMAHEFMHGLGFLAHPKSHDNRSVLEQTAPADVTTFTPWDAAAINMLYDRRLKAGLSRDRALPIARVIAGELAARWPEHPPRMRPGGPLQREPFPARAVDAPQR